MTALSPPAVLASMSFEADDGGVSSRASVSPEQLSPRSILSNPLDQPVRTTSRPAPLPVFVFPSRAPASPTPRSAPSSFSRASGRRPSSAFELSGGPDKTIAVSERSPRTNLPEFSFGGAGKVQSPPTSPTNIPRTGFHRRGGSEFVGGDGKSGSGIGLMSSSPTKVENSLPLPSAPPPGLPGGRARGHAHRRSAAISCHDLSMILKPDPNLSKGGASAPTSPAAPGFNPQSMESVVGSDAQNSSPEKDTPTIDSTPIRALNRNRVGFSDTIDIIPRPLSLVSSDSSSTIRPGHSLTGSLSSIVSAGTSSPLTKEKRTSNLSIQLPDNRPKTADQLAESSPGPSDAPRRRNSIPLLAEAAASPGAPLTPRSLKKYFFGAPQSMSGESSPKSRPTSAVSLSNANGSKTTLTGFLASEESTDASVKDEADIPLRSTESHHSRPPSVRSSKKGKRGRFFTSILSTRKTRVNTRKQKFNRRSPTPPRPFGPMNPTQVQELQEQDTVEDPQEQQTLPPIPDLQTYSPSWQSRRVFEEEYTSPMIDLDAALGPFNTPNCSTPTSFGADWEEAQRPTLSKRAKMHSSGGTGAYGGLSGTPYHRRAESAPEIDQPQPRFLHRYGSSSTMTAMEDVFEEDEDEWEDAKTSDKGSVSKDVEDKDTGLGIDIKVVDAEGTDTSMDFGERIFERGVRHMGSGLSDSGRYIGSTKSEHSARSLIDEPIAEESSPVEIADDSIPPRSESGSKSSDSTATPPLRPAAKELAPVDIQNLSLQPPFPTPNSPPSTTPSSFPSPRSPYSYDAQRISTAPSSVTDEQGFQSLLMGEPGPEVRMSVDDVPSLTSSTSTMTRDGNPQFRDGQRSSSLSSTAAISGKRGSMASLSRLINSSHGEKSKLSIEMRPSTSEGLEKKEKASRGKRISRMMQFWKPKDS